jgi:hypothetical protein
MSKNHKKINYIVKLTRVMDEGERGYSDKCLKVLIERDDMSYPEAHEFMEFNVVGAYVGDFTPIFVHSLV